jgi:hypothetical protein
MIECAIQIRGRTIKIAGLSIIRVPKNKTCVINGFYIKNGKIIKRGEISFVPYNDATFHLINNCIEFCCDLSKTKD